MLELGDCLDEAIEESVANGALEGAAGETALRFHVADLGFDGAAAAQELGQPRCQLAGSRLGYDRRRDCRVWSAC